MKTYFKTVYRMFKKHIARFVSMILIVLVSVGFVAGLGSSAEKINVSLDDFYVAQNVGDMIIKSKKGGFSEEEIAAAFARYGKEHVAVGMSLDVYLRVGEEEQLTRLIFFDSEVQEINRFVSVQKSETAGNAKVERSDSKLKGHALGTELKLDFSDILKQLAEQNGEALSEQTSSLLSNLSPVTVRVGEIVGSPLLFGEDGEPSYLNEESVLENLPDTTGAINQLICLDNVLFLSYDLVPVYGDMIPAALKPFVPQATLEEKLIGRGDIYVTLSDRTLFRHFSKEYQSRIDSEKAALTELYGGDARVITLYDNYSFHALSSYSDKVMGIGYVLMAAFLFVTALVTLSTMTRLLEEERAQIACLKTLGYSGGKILMKYLLFALIATGIGGAGAYFVNVGIAALIYIVFNYSFAMPPMSGNIAMWFFLLTFFFIVAATLVATLMSGRRLVSEKPAELLRPKAPKAGKKVFLERVPVLWNRLSFKYKSTMRNVLRYIYRFLMTVVSIAISAALVFAGLALLDMCIFGDIVSTSIMMIAIVVVVFAGLLAGIVIYTLTNINISERNRELATLMVLGYFDGEVAGYIYREIYIDTFVGIVFGYPLSLLICVVLFRVLGMGAISSISWFVWLIMPVVVLLFTLTVTLLLRRKIVKIDMNESLKAIE